MSSYIRLSMYSELIYTGTHSIYSNIAIDQSRQPPFVYIPGASNGNSRAPSTNRTAPKPKMNHPGSVLFKR